MKAFSKALLFGFLAVYASIGVFGAEGDDESLVTQVIQKLTDLISQQKFVIPPKQDPAFLLKALRKNGMNVHRTIENIEKYYKLINDNKDLFEIKFGVLHYIYNGGSVKLLLNKSKNGTPVIFLKLEDRLAKYTQHIGLAFAFFAEKLAEEKNVQVSGITLIFDAGQYSEDIIEAVFTKLNVAVLPVKFAQVLVINSSRFQKIGFSAAKTARMLSKEKADMTEFIDIAGLSDVVDPKVLPISLGGEMADSKAWVSIAVMKETFREDTSFSMYWK